MSYRLPPLNGLRAFEATARHMSIKRAADELCVTPGAVSQQVKALEAALGIKLFRRLPRGLLLTASGESYLPSLSRAFAVISDSTERVAPALRRRRFRLAIAPPIMWAGYPAIERLNGRKGTEFNVHLSVTDDLSRLLDGGVDAVLRRPARSHPGLHIEHVEIKSGRGPVAPVTLVTLPGLAGCQQHRALLKLLRK